MECDTKDTCHGVVGGVGHLETMALTRLVMIYQRCKGCMTDDEKTYAEAIIYGNSNNIKR